MLRFLYNTLNKAKPHFEKGGKFEKKEINDFQFDIEKLIHYIFQQSLFFYFF